jgi:hypothetical protein
LLKEQRKIQKRRPHVKRFPTKKKTKKQKKKQTKKQTNKQTCEQRKRKKGVERWWETLGEVASMEPRWWAWHVKGDGDG